MIQPSRKGGNPGGLEHSDSRADSQAGDGGDPHSCTVATSRDDCTMNLGGTVQEGKTCSAGSCAPTPGNKKITWWGICPESDCTGTLATLQNLIEALGSIRRWTGKPFAFRLGTTRAVLGRHARCGSREQPRDRLPEIDHDGTRLVPGTPPSLLDPLSQLDQPAHMVALRGPVPLLPPSAFPLRGVARRAEQHIAEEGRLRGG